MIFYRAIRDSNPVRANDLNTKKAMGKPHRFTL